MTTTQTNQQWLDGKGIDHSEIIKQARGRQVCLVDEPPEPCIEALDVISGQDVSDDEEELGVAASPFTTGIPPRPGPRSSAPEATPLDSTPQRSAAALDISSTIDPCNAIPDVDVTQSPPPTQLRFTPWVLGGFGLAAAIATVVTLVSTLMNGPTETVATQFSTAAPRIIEVPAASPPPDADGPLPFTAFSDCPAGSTSAQSVADPDSSTPWICVRSVDGQVLEIDLGRSYVITAVSIVPGAVTQVDGRADQPDCRLRLNPEQPAPVEK